MRKLIAILIFFWTNSYGDDLNDKLHRMTDSLKNYGINSIIVHRYSIFGGRFEIPYDQKELQCGARATVAHIFWAKNNQWNCLRLDYCGLFELIEIKPIRFNNIKIDPEIKFNQGSPHFTQYNLTVIYNGSEDNVRLSGFQLTKEKNGTTKTIKTINKIIEELENKGRFKRVN
ncbi:hypothetical protein GXP67_11335 [Rhodocytophaga rosea]|uniref:Uncharacterized protein n=1 Tax=Rhodocytophaga rosea TaxID=2704465 RepID=A0A6C0GHA1_9BACT|nr:hypothetical protein [Rhodocytophaga rosea]QHT67194.1 hypothetical protein GXP67_11335 [Rhodocytophaga rosea]